MKRTGFLAAFGALTAVATVPAATVAAVTVPAAAVAAATVAAVPFAARAPENAFRAATAGDTNGVACRRPAPDNRVSTTIHCYRPDDLRAFYGLGPLASSNDGAGQTIVLVDAYGSPTAANDLTFFAQSFGGPTPSFETAFPLGTPDYKNATGNGSGQSGPTSADGWAGEANLDVQWAYAMAPKAHLVLLATPPAETQGVQGLPNLMKAIDWAIAKYAPGTVFSMSFGTDEQAFGSTSAAATQFAKFDATFQRGQAKHDTFFSSSGDTGSVGVVRSHRASTTGTTPEVSYPNVSPFVTSVGGTQVQSGWTWNPTQDKPFLADGTRTGRGPQAVAPNRCGTRAGPASRPAAGCPRSTSAPATRTPCLRSSEHSAASRTSHGTRPSTEGCSSSTPTSPRSRAARSGESSAEPRRPRRKSPP